MLLLLSLGLAAEPETIVGDDGLTIRYFVPHDVDAVRAVLDDTDKVYGLSPDLVSYTVEDEGSCDAVTTEARGLLSNLRMHTERCKTSDTSWRDRLVSSEDFDQYEVSWAVSAVEGGTVITYHLKAELSIPVPDKVMYAKAGEAALNQLNNLYRSLE